MELMVLGSFLAVTVSFLGIVAAKRRHGESEQVRIAQVLAICTGVAAAVVFGVWFARFQTFAATDSVTAVPNMFELIIPSLLLLSMGGRRHGR